MPADAPATAPSEASAPRPRGRILGLTGFAHALDHVAEDVLPPVLETLAARFTLGDPALGWLGTLHAFVFGAMALPAGIATTLGYGRACLVLGLALGGIGACAVAVAPGLGSVTLAIVLLGVGAGCYHPPGLTMVATLTERRGRAMAFHGLCGNIGIALAPLLTLLAARDFRLAFLVPGVAMLAAAGGALRLPRPAPRRAAEATTADGRAGTVVGAFVAALGLLFVAGFVLKAVKFFLNRDVVEALRPGHGAHAADLGGLLVAGAYVMGIFGQILGGRTLDRVGADRAFALYLALAGAAALAMARTPGAWVVVPAGAFAFFHFAGQPAGNEMVARLIAPRWRGLAYGLQFTVSFGLASVGAAWAGYYSDAGRLAEAFASGGALMLGAAAVALAVRASSPAARAALLGAAR